MRIAHCSHEIQGVRGGGIGTYVGEAGRALRRAGHETWLFTLDPGAEGRQRIDALGAFDQVVYIDRGPDGGHLEEPKRYHFGFARQVLARSQMCHDALMRSGVHFDWIEFPDYEGFGAVPIEEQRLLHTYGDAVLAVHLHSPLRECLDYNLQTHRIDIRDREQCALEDEAIRRAPFRVCPSLRLRELVDERLGTSGTEILRYPMVLPESWPTPPRPRERLEDLRIAYFGRIEPRKGVHHLVEAFRDLPGVRLELIGEDRPSSPFGTSLTEWLSRDLPPNVVFRGGVPRDQLLREIPDIDVCIFPSLWENWPNVCIESMAQGRVVLGARNGGMSEMIEAGKSGFLVDGNDPADIARVVREELGAALGRLDEIGDAAARRIREITEPERYVRRLEGLCEQAKSRGQAVSSAQVSASVEAKVSFLVPFYKESLEVVGAAVDSALAQTHPEIEVLVVDDGSPRPDRAQILSELESKDARVRVVSKPNGGLASARNFGLEHITGDFVICLDADNLARPDYAEVGLEAFRNEPDCEALVPQYRIFDDRSGETVTHIASLPVDPQLAYFRNEFGDAGAMFRASVFRERGLRYDSQVDAYCDWALWLDCAREGVVVRQLPRVLYDYRKHGASMMATTAWQRHLALVGLLIHRHPIPMNDAERQEALTAMVQGFGMGSILANLGGRAETWERPTETAIEWFRDEESLRVASAYRRIAGAIPGWRKLVSPLIRNLSDAYGRHKDRRRERRDPS